MQEKTFIFDAGGTKTDVRIIHLNNEIESKLLPGYNPNKENTNFLSQIEFLNISNKDQVYFYGSGLGNKIHAKNLKKFFNTLNIEIQNDLIGSSRALLGNNEGIISIMGTGGVVGYYSNQKLIETIGGYGYLIDDTGGGLELGKKIISNWLRGNLSEKSNLLIEDFYNVNKNDFINHFYQTKNIDIISKICDISIELSKYDFVINKIIKDYFDLFTLDYIKPLANKYKKQEIYISGSIGFHFQEFLNISFNKNILKLNKVIQYPIDYLVDFHKLPKK